MTTPQSEPAQLWKRLDALDDLDARFGDLQPEHLFDDARALQARLEGINTSVYESIRADIVRGASARALLPWIQSSVASVETASGLGFDHWDEVLSGILQLREPGEPRLHPVPEMVFYQPTPVRHILHLIRASALSENDVFVDLGSGLGHVAMLTSMLTGARSIGIEAEPAYVASAQECAQRLRLSRVRFIPADARAADLSSGSVFYLYSPFTGSILAHVLGRLRKENADRPIKICTLGPCTCALAEESWLRPVAPPGPKQITVFQGRF